MRITIFIILLLVLATTGLIAKKLPPLTTVDKVDLTRYAGVWYQFAYFPNSFQSKTAVLTTAEYKLNPKGYVDVINSEYKDKSGKILDKKINGKAFVRDKVTNAKLGVQFFWPFRGAYWITALDTKDYQWAVVSDPSRNYLWILTRKPQISKELYAFLLQEIRSRQIETDRIVMTGWLE